MSLIYLGIVFIVIIVLLAFRRPLYQAISGGLLAIVLLYHMPLAAIFTQTVHVFTDWSLFSILVSLYLITFLQRMLEARSQIKLAQDDLNGLFHNRRINVSVAALFMVKMWRLDDVESGELISAATLQIRDGVYTLGDIAVREGHRNEGFGRQIYKVLIYFDKLYAVMNEVEKRQIMEALIAEVQVYEERQANGQWLKSIKFKLPIIEEDMNISLYNDEYVETICALRRIK